jgi:tRNA A37 threonylcarbamoyladenosine synthetase subunit TsaC/SUA5/YrdC
VNKSFNLGLNVLTERATTWLLPADEQIPQWIKGQHTQVAVRVTNHPLCTALCNAFNGFIVSTSANPAGLNQHDHYKKPVNILAQN